LKRPTRKIVHLQIGAFAKWVSRRFAGAFASRFSLGGNLGADFYEFLD